jgi:hypothetical protein
VPAMEGQRHRTFCQQAFQCDQMAILIRQAKVRHDIADLRCGTPGLSRFQAGDKSINRLGKGRASIANTIGNIVKPLAQRHRPITHLLKRRFKCSHKRVGHRRAPVGQIIAQSFAPSGKLLFLLLLWSIGGFRSRLQSHDTARS